VSGRRIELRVEPLERALLGGLPPPAGEGERVRADLGILAYFEDERPLRGLLAFLDWRAAGGLSKLVRQRWCTGEVGEAVLLPARRGLPIARLVLVGLGPSADFDVVRAEEAAREAVSIARRLHPRDVVLAMPGGTEEREHVEALFSAVLHALEEEPRMAGPGGPSQDGDDDVCRWWVIADPRHVQRLRRLLGGPPRPT
jgi:hypothetical protein